MKKKASLIALCALSLTAAFALAGCELRCGSLEPRPVPSRSPQRGFGNRLRPEC